MVKNPSANARDRTLILELGQFPGGGKSNPLQYSCLGNPMKRGSKRATVNEVANMTEQPNNNNNNNTGF